MNRNVLFVTLLISVCILTDLSSGESSLIQNVRNKRSDIVLFDKIKTCVRNSLNSLDGTDINCSFKRMFRVLVDEHRTNCNNCNPYFFCLANSVAINECGTNDKVRQVAEAVSACNLLRSNDDTIPLILEASTYGRSQGDCNSMYLCPHGCGYDASSKNCTRSCR